jgi:hypothetical protein
MQASAWKYGGKLWKIKARIVIPNEIRNENLSLRITSIIA